MGKNVLETIVEVELIGERYKILAVLLAEKKIGKETRPCVSCHQGRVAKELFEYRLLRFKVLAGEKGQPFSHVVGYLHQQDERDGSLTKIIVDEASRILNSWPSDLSPINVTAPEFQPDGQHSLNERLVLCDQCVATRQIVALELPIMETDRAA